MSTVWLLTPASPLFPRLEPEATRAVSDYIDMTHAECSELTMSPSMVSGSFSPSVICRKMSYASGEIWRNKKETFSSQVSVPLAHKSRTSSAILKRVQIELEPDFTRRLANAFHALEFCTPRDGAV